MNTTESRAARARQLIVSCSNRTQTPHLSSCLSSVDILSVIYERTLNPSSHLQVYLSKGHAALAFYSVLASYGHLPESQLDTYCQDSSFLEGHVNSRVANVPLSTGSLGHALPFAIGRALHSSQDHWVVMSDGELDEGSNWEALLIASHLKLRNLNVVLDRNHLQSFGSTEDTIQLEPLNQKFEAFGWTAIEVDGHNHDSLKSARDKAMSTKGPCAILARTTKGYGVRDAEENPTLYHYKPAAEKHVAEIIGGGFEVGS